MRGLSVPVYNNNVELALKKLKKKEYYVKPSTLKREKKNLAILRAKHNQIK